LPCIVVGRRWGIPAAAPPSRAWPSGRAVGEIAAALPISRSAVSQHLKILKDAGLVTDHAAGTRRVYRLNPAGVAALRDQLDTFWRRSLDGYQDVVEQPIEEGS
jgi:DNA-binding transcriptional ArsR family regulator